MNRLPRWPIAVLIASATALGGCASRSYVHEAPVSSAPYSTGYGRVTNIEVVAVDQRGPGAGAVLGAVIGGVLGNQVGKGTGRAVATGAGVVGGAIVGNAIQKRHESDVYRVTVRFDNGERRTFDYQRIGDMQVGDRVRVDGGELHLA